MIRILLKGEGTPPTERELKPGTVTIGRKPDNDFHLEDATVSGHHAKIVTYFQSSYIEDLSSTNGTFVNGRRVRMHTLHGGDIISIGKFELRFGAAPAPAEPPTLGADATIFMAREDLKPIVPPAPTASPTATAPAPVDPAPVERPQPLAAPAPSAQLSSAPAPATGAFFQVMVGERAGPRMPVPEQGLELLPGVRVQRDGESFVVHRAAAPRQGVVRLNSRDLSPGRVTLKDMDMLQVNSAWMAFFSS